MNKVAKSYIDSLNLLQHPEGGYYKETYRSELVVKNVKNQDRAISTAIYYLLSGEAFSAFHRIKSDEFWHFYDGSCELEILVLDEGGLTVLRLGLDMENGAKPQQVVPAGKWFAARLSKAGEFVLAGCTVAPGFDFADFELADKETLLKQFPAEAKVIEAMCI